MVSRMRAALCAHSRSCQPATMAGLDAPSAMSTRAGQSGDRAAPSAIATGLRTPMGSGPIFSRNPGARTPIAVANAKASKRRHLADPQPVEARLPSRRGDLKRLLVGPVQPERQHRLDRRPHSIAASAGRSSRMRPGQFARRLVDLEVRGGRVRVAEARCSGEPS